MAESTKMTWEGHPATVEDVARQAAIEVTAAHATSRADFETLMQHLDLPIDPAALTIVRKNIQRRRKARLS